MVELRDPQLNTLWMSGKGYSKEIVVKSHRHDFYQLQYLVSGSENLTIENQNFYLKPNFISILDSNQTHSYSFNRDSNLIDIKFSMVPALRDLLHPLFEKSVFLVENEMIRNRFSQLIDLGIYFQNHNNNSILINIDTQIKLLLLELAQPVVPEPIVLPNDANTPLLDGFRTTNHLLESMTQFMIDHHNEKITLDMLQAEFHYSKPQIIKLFSESYHQTPMHILQSIRLDHAKKLLSETNFPIGQIANEVGFNNNYFTKLFLKHENQLPSDYRLGRRKKADEIILKTSFDITTEP